MNFDNLFDYCDSSYTSNNPAVIYVGSMCGNSLITFAYDIITKKLLTYSCEWLYLIKSYYNKPSSRKMYETHIQTFYECQKKPIRTDFQHIDVVSFITSFSTGTVHGYTGLYYNLFEYFKHPDRYGHMHIAVYKNSQKGILDIIRHLVHYKFLDENKILYLDSNIRYLFKTVTTISHTFHVFHKSNDHNLGYLVAPLLEKWVICQKEWPEYYKSLQLPEGDRICIIKSTESHNLTASGSVLPHLIQKFCQRHNLTFFEPVPKDRYMDEIILIHAINKSNVVVLSWGTAFMKNHIYISNECKKIVVLVIGNEFINQYNNAKGHPCLITRFRNAAIEYHIVPNDLNVQLEI